MKIWFSMPLENLLQVVHSRSRYLTCSTNIDRSTEEKIKVIRVVDWKILAQKWKNQISLGFEVSEYSGQTLRKECFFNESWFSMPLENFLQVVQPRSRYLTSSPNIALSTGGKIKVIRYIDQK